MDTQLEEKINEFLKVADEMSAEHYKKSGFTFAPPPTYVAEVSSKWAKIITMKHHHDGTSHTDGVYGFICLQDYSTKTLGNLKRGDIHRAASYKAPAKHARGNVFDANFKDCLTPYGIVYLNG